MKLQSKYSRATMIATIAVLLAGSIGYYFFLRYALISQVDEALSVEEVEIYHYLKVYDSLPPQSEFRDQRIEFTEAETPVKRTFISKKIFSPAQHEKEICRQLVFPVQVKGKHYTAIVTKSQVEAEDLLMFILSITTAIILLLAVFIFIINRILLQKIWQPFYATLSAMKNYNLSSPQAVSLEKNNIDEFNALNEAWVQMTQKINHDYESLKTFSDNASHEMQTPLAIINSKLDLLIQDQQLAEKNIGHLQAMYNALDKLTKLNQSLLLITKIENNQFDEKTTIELNALFKERLLQLDELIQSRQLVVNTWFYKASVLMNPMLANILVNNLLINAIRHNKDGGSINITTGEGCFIISNSTNGNALDPSLIFNRFEKSKSSGGTGLGLHIVKQICDAYGFTIQYKFKNHEHSFEIHFSITPQLI